MVADVKKLQIFLKDDKKKPVIEIEGCSSETIKAFYDNLNDVSLTAIRIADFIFDRELFHSAIIE